MGLISGFKKLKKLSKFIPGHATRVARKAKFIARAEIIKTLRLKKKLSRAKNIKRIRRNRKFAEFSDKIPAIAKKAVIGGGIASGGFVAGRLSKRKKSSRRR